jgi:aarF domain-containing kinase
MWLSRVLSCVRGRRRTAVSLFQVKLESNFASIVVAIMVLEGLGRSLDPTLDILEAAKPFLFKGPASFL